MRGIPEYIAQARTILHASVGQVQYGPSAGNIFWYPPNIKPCNIIIIIYKNRHFYFNSVAVVKFCCQLILYLKCTSAGLTKFSLHCKERVMDVIITSQ